MVQVGSGPSSTKHITLASHFFSLPSSHEPDLKKNKHGLGYCFYADDTQFYMPIKRNVSSPKPQLESLKDIKGWLNVQFRIHLKILFYILTYNTWLLTPYIPSSLLRSMDQFPLAVPKTRLKTRGDRAFYAIAPTPGPC